MNREITEHGPDTAPIDVDGFRSAMRAAGIEEIVEPTLVVFAEESRRLLADLDDAVASGDATSLRRAAHTIKGSSGNVHAHELSRIAQSLEAAAEVGSPDEVGALLEALRREHGAVMDALAESGIA